MAEKVILEAEVKSNVGEVTKDVNKLDKATDRAKTGFTSLGRSIRGIGLALKAAGIGLVVAAIAKFLQLVGSNQRIVNTFNTAMTAMTIAFNDLFNYLSENIGAVQEYFKILFEDPLPSIEKIGTAIKDHIIGRFRALTEWYKILAETTMNFWSGNFPEALESAKKALLILPDIITGVDDTINKVKTTLENIAPSVTQYTKSVWNQAAALTEAQLKAQLAEVQFAKLNAEFLRDAEIQRQIRDNVNLTFKARLEANEKLGKILEEQQKSQQAQLQIRIDAAKQLHEVDKENIENKIAYLGVLNEELELNETIAGQESEQLTNQIGLENELRDAKAQTLVEGMEMMERELEELKIAYDAKVRLAKQAGMDTVAIDKLYSKQRKAIIRASVNDQLSAAGDLAGALSGLAGDNKELAAASAIIDTYVGANKAFAQGGVLGYISAAAIIVAGLANVKKIYQTDVGSGGGGGGGGGGSAPQTPAPQMMSGAFELTGGVTPEPLKAYVLTDEMTNSQNQLANIRRRATI